MSSKHHRRDDPSLYSSKKTLGVLHLFSESDQILDQSIFPLKSGDNFIGSGRHCDIILPYSSIDTMLCKISLNPDNEFTIEDLDSKIGIYRTLHDQLRQKLKPNKVYDLYPDKPFYIGDQYRCLFKPAPSKKHEENSGGASPLHLNDYLKPQHTSQYRRSSRSRSPSPEAQTEIPQTLPIASLEQEMEELENAYKYEASPEKDRIEKSTLKPPTKPSDFVNSLFHDDYDNYSNEERAETPAKVEQKPTSEVKEGPGPYTKTFKSKNMGLKTETRESEPEFEPHEKIEESSLRAGNDAKTSLLAQLGKKKVEEDEDRADTVSISDDEPEEEKLPEENHQKEAEENSNNSVSFVKHFVKKGKIAPTPADEVPGRRKDEKIAEIPSSFTGLEEDEATTFAMTAPKKPEKASKKKEKNAKKVTMEAEDDEEEEDLKPKNKEKTPMKVAMEVEDDEEEEDDPLKLIPRAKPVEARNEEKEFEDLEIEEDKKGKKRGRPAKSEAKKIEEKPNKKEIEEEKPRRGGQRKAAEGEKEKKVTPVKEKKSPISKGKEQAIHEEDEKPRRGQTKPVVEEEKERKVTPIKDKNSPISKGKEQTVSQEPKGRSKKAEDVTPIREKKSPISKGKEQTVSEEPKGKSKKGEDVTPRKSQRGVKNKEHEEEEEKTGRGMRSKRSTEKAREQEEEKVSKAGKNAKQAGSPDTKTPMRATPLKGKNKEENEVKKGRRNEKTIGSPDTKTPIRVARSEKRVGSPDTKTLSKASVTPVRGKKKEENKQEEEVKKGRVSQRLAKKSAEKDEEEEEEEPEEAPKRGRNAKKAPEKKAPAEVKKSTRGKSKVQEEEEEEEEERPVLQKGIRVRGKSRIEEEEEEEKPVPKRGARGKSKVQSQEEEPRRKKEAPKKQEKQTKGKTAKKQEEKKRGRKPAKVIEMEIEDEEDEEEEPESEPEPEEAPKRGRKSKKAPVEVKKNTRGKRSLPNKEDNEEEEITKKRKTPKAAASKTKNTSTDEAELHLQKRNAYRVLFSGFAVNDKKVANAKKNLKTIGVNISEDMDNFNVLVMSELRRTIKFLYAVSQGASVVSFDWVTDSLKEGKAVAPDDYLFEDESIENTHHFKLNSLLKKVRRGEKDLLKGYHVWMPSNIKPSYEEVKTLVEGIQGAVVKTKPGKYKEDVIILVNEGDEKQAKHFVDLGFRVHTTELVYSGILQQKLNFSQNQVKVKGNK